MAQTKEIDEDEAGERQRANGPPFGLQEPGYFHHSASYGKGDHISAPNTHSQVRELIVG